MIRKKETIAEPIENVEEDADQYTFSFEVDKVPPSDPEPDPEPVLRVKEEENPEPAASDAELENKEPSVDNNQRVKRLKGLSMKLKNPKIVSEYENEPAFKRRQIDLEDVPHSSDENISRYTLLENEDKEEDDKIEFRKNNSFLHDNVD